MQKHFLAPLVFGLLVTGCMPAYTTTPSNVSTKTTKDLCQAIKAGTVNANQSESGLTALRELADRNVFTDAEMLNVARGSAAVGMSEEAGLCATGYYWYGINTTTTAAGERKQYLLGDGKYNKRTYLYAENGRIVAIQD